MVALSSVDEHSGDSEIGTHRETFEQTPMSSHQAFKVALALKAVLEEYWVWRFETNELVIRRASNSSPSCVSQTVHAVLHTISSNCYITQRFYFSRKVSSSGTSASPRLIYSLHNKI